MTDRQIASERPVGAPERLPNFSHLDDVPWRKVRAQRNADGSESFVHEKWIAYSREPQYLSLYARYDPGMIVRRHGHHSPHIVFILEGEVWIGDQHCGPGMHVELPYGAAFGPIIAGDAGAVMFEVMMGNPSSWGDQPELFDQALERAGAAALPHPPYDLPTDTRPG